MSDLPVYFLSPSLSFRSSLLKLNTSSILPYFVRRLRCQNDSNLPPSRHSWLPSFFLPREGGGKAPRLLYVGQRGPRVSRCVEWLMRRGGQFSCVLVLWFSPPSRLLPRRKRRNFSDFSSQNIEVVDLSQAGRRLLCPKTRICDLLRTTFWPKKAF